MSVKLAINGFGRIGRAAFKIALANPEVEVVAVNDLGDINNLAYLLRYDSVYGRYAQEVEVQEGKLIVGGREVKVLSEADPTKLPWGDMQIDVVVESTGIFTGKADAEKHLQAGAKKVIISAPSKDDMVTVVTGVNDDATKGQNIISNASCTTNCASPMMAVLENTFGVEKALLTTVHAYTASQSLVDGPAKKDMRGGRGGAINIVPASTGAAIAATKTIPSLEGKFDGVSLRVPVPVVSVSDVVCILKKDVTAEEINEAYKKAAESPEFEGVLAVTEEELVSTDFIGDPHSATVDLTMTRVVGGNLVKVMAWYDNEWGYSNRLIDQVVSIGKEE